MRLQNGHQDINTFFFQSFKQSFVYVDQASDFLRGMLKSSKDPLRVVFSHERL